MLKLLNLYQSNIHYLLIIQLEPKIFENQLEYTRSPEF